MNNEKFDTLEVMSDEEKKELILIQKVKSNIKHFVGIDNIIETISNLINESSYFSFFSERNKKYISKKKPLFVLKMNEKELSKVMDTSFLKKNKGEFIIDGKTNVMYEKDLIYIRDLVYTEVIKPYSDYLMTFLKDNDKFNKLIKDNFDLDVSLIPMKTMLLTSSVTFAIKTDLATGKILLEYAI